MDNDTAYNLNYARNEAIRLKGSLRWTVLAMFFIPFVLILFGAIAYMAPQESVMSFRGVKGEVSKDDNQFMGLSLIFGGLFCFWWLRLRYSQIKQAIRKEEEFIASLMEAGGHDSTK